MWPFNTVWPLNGGPLNGGSTVTCLLISLQTEQCRYLDRRDILCKLIFSEWQQNNITAGTPSFYVREKMIKSKTLLLYTPHISALPVKFHSSPKANILFSCT